MCVYFCGRQTREIEDPDPATGWTVHLNPPTKAIHCVCFCTYMCVCVSEGPATANGVELQPLGFTCLGASKKGDNGSTDSFWIECTHPTTGWIHVICLFHTNTFTLISQRWVKDEAVGAVCISTNAQSLSVLFVYEDIGFYLFKTLL